MLSQKEAEEPWLTSDDRRKTMTPESSEALTDFARQRGINLESATPGQGIDAMILFFRDVRPESRIIEGAGDMLPSSRGASIVLAEVPASS